jgi:hypothetical protein
MLRRCLLAVAGLALALTAGCGSMMIAAMDGEPVWLRHRLDWTVYQPSHRVALATLEVLKTELAEAKIVDEELTEDKRFNTPDGKTPKPGEVRIPDDYPAFWLDGLVDQRPMIVNCRFCDIRGKTKDGKPVEAVVRLEIVGKSEQHTVLSIQVGRKGDEKSNKATKDLIDKISDRVLQPKLPPGSPEERAALSTAFSRQPADNVDYVVASGEIRIKRN